MQRFPPQGKNSRDKHVFPLFKTHFFCDYILGWIQKFSSIVLDPHLAAKSSSQLLAFQRLPFSLTNSCNNNKKTLFAL